LYKGWFKNLQKRIDARSVGVSLVSVEKEYIAIILCVPRVIINVRKLAGELLREGVFVLLVLLHL
jgi:hypothetical protein